MMRVELLSHEGCPLAEPVRTLLRECLAAAGLTAPVIPFRCSSTPVTRGSALRRRSIRVTTLLASRCPFEIDLDSGA